MHIPSESPGQVINQVSFESGESTNLIESWAKWLAQLDGIQTEPFHECKQESILHMYSVADASAGG